VLNTARGARVIAGTVIAARWPVHPMNRTLRRAVGVGARRSSWRTPWTRVRGDREKRGKAKKEAGTDQKHQNRPESALDKSAHE
jgi:hypothetical protein